MLSLHSAFLLHAFSPSKVSSLTFIVGDECLCCMAFMSSFSDFVIEKSSGVLGAFC